MLCRQEFPVDVRLREVASDRDIQIEQRDRTVFVDVEFLRFGRRGQDAGEFVREFGLVRFPIRLRGADHDAAFGGERLDVIAARRRGHEEDLLASGQVGKQLGEIGLMDIRPRQVEPRVLAVVVTVSDDDHPQRIVRLQFRSQCGDALFEFLASRAACGLDDLGIRIDRLVPEEELSVENWIELASKLNPSRGA